MSVKITKREQEILQYFILGKTNKFIGKALEISPYTVRDHVTNLLSKFSVTNRTELVAILSTDSTKPVDLQL